MGHSHGAGLAAVTAPLRHQRACGKIARDIIMRLTIPGKGKYGTVNAVGSVRLHNDRREGIAKSDAIAEHAGREGADLPA